MKSTMFLITIIALSSIGVGYGAWNEGLNTDASIDTGNLDICFTSGGISEDGIISADTSADGKTLYINGIVVGDYNGSVSFKIENLGTVPGEFTNKGEVILPNQSKTYDIPINISYSGGMLPMSLQSSAEVQPLESVEDIERIVEEMIYNMYPVETYTFSDTYYIEQGL